MKIDTLITHAGRKPEDWHGFVNPPVYHGSTVLFPTIREYYESQKEAYNGYRYAREGNPTSRCLEEALGEIEGGRTLALSSGITAVAASLLSQLSAGDHLLMTDSAYGPSRRLAAIELKRFGIDTTFYDPLIGAGIKELFQPNTRVVYTESPGSLTFEVQDIPAISNAAHDAGIIVIMDNSWATPLFYKAFNKGVDIVVHSATKYINGHSDVVGGIITCNEDSYTSVSRFAKTIGIAASPENCFLMQRGLRSLGVRMQVHQKSALYLAGKLREHPLVEKVLHPREVGVADRRRAVFPTDVFS